jgi:hypothetical protein
VLCCLRFLNPSRRWFRLQEIYEFYKVHWSLFHLLPKSGAWDKEKHKKVQDVLSHNHDIFMRHSNETNGCWGLAEWNDDDSKAASPSPRRKALPRRKAARKNRSKSFFDGDSDDEVELYHEEEEEEEVKAKPTTALDPCPQSDEDTFTQVAIILWEMSSPVKKARL